MKLKLIKKNNNSNLFKFNILKSQFYNQQMFLNNLKFETLTINLRQTLKLIYEYHLNNKLIYFVNFPNIENQKLKQKFKKTKHKFFSEQLLAKKLKDKIFLKPSCIILFNCNIKDISLNNLLQLNIPIVLFNNLSLIDSNFTYNNINQTRLIKNQRLNKFIISLVYAIIKKS